MLDWNLYYTKQQNNHRMSIRNEIGVPVNYNYFGIPTLDRPYLVTFFYCLLPYTTSDSPANCMQRSQHQSHKLLELTSNWYELPKSTDDEPVSVVSCGHSS
jgi:hypothetical protein